MMLGEGLHNQTMPDVQLQQVLMKNLTKYGQKRTPLILAGTLYWYTGTRQAHLAVENCINIWHTRTSWFQMWWNHRKYMTSNSRSATGINPATCVFSRHFKLGPPFLQHHDLVRTRRQSNGFPLAFNEPPMSGYPDLTRKALRYLP